MTIHGTTLDVAEGTPAGPRPTVRDEVVPAEPATATSSPRTSPTGDRRRRLRLTPRSRRVALAATTILSAAGLAGTIGFGLAWSDLRSADAGAAAARQAASRFLVDLTNFNAHTVDRDFAAVTAAATGPFATQADQFFGSSIRQQLENAQASSQGQIRSLYVETASADHASVYAVVDQTYSNNKIQAPQSDVLRVVVDLAPVGGLWKVAQLTVLEGPQAAAGPSGQGG